MKKKLLTFAVVSFGLLAAVAGVQGVYNAYQTMSDEASESQEAPQSDGGIWTDSETVVGWEEAQVITNGKIAWNNLCADGDFANYPSEELVNFVVNEWIDGTRVDLATARVTVDPLDADAFADAVAEESGFKGLNYCIKVVSRDPEIDAETGEPQKIDSWDTQFFITFGEDYALKQGDMVRLRMNVKADKAATVSSQLHAAPGAFKHFSAVGSVDFTTEWTEFESEFTVNESGASSYTVAFNLAELKEANTYYFDDIDVVISREKALTEDEEMYDQTIPEGWIDLIANGDFEDEGLDNFVAHDYVTFDGEKQEFVAPRVITDPSNEANKCIVVTTDANPKQDYDSQIFITVPENQHFYEGEVIRLRMRVKADVAQTASSQSHAAPGSYIYYSCLGDVPFQTVWTNFDSGEITVTSSMMQSGSNPGPFRTIALNLSKISAGNNLYFDDVQLLVMRTNSSDALKSDLAVAIAKAQGASDYLKTEDSYADLQDAIDGAELVYFDDNATEDEVQAAIDAVNAAFAGLTYVEGYIPLTNAMFKRYASIDEPGEGAATGCAFSLYDTADLPYGDANVNELYWADLSEYSQLIIVTEGDVKPRVLMNRLEAGGQQGATQEESLMLDINDNSGNTWSTEKYCVEEKNLFKIDLASIVADYGFARLHCIKKQGWASGVYITDLILSNEKLNPNPNNDSIPEAAEFVAGNNYYLYNVEAGMYYCAANSWGTQASVGAAPLLVRFYNYNGSKDTYYLRNYFDEDWMYAFFDSDYAMFVDRNAQTDYGWNIVKAGDYYRLQAAPEGDINPYYNSTNYPDAYVGLDVTDDDENTALSPFLEEGQGHYIDWILVDASGMNVPDPEPELSENWLNLVHNGTCDGDDDRSILGRDGENYANGELFSTRFEDGVGVDGGRGVVVSSIDYADNAWDTQFFITTSHAFQEGEHFKISFDYRADDDAVVSTESQAAPAEFIYWDAFGSIDFTPEWQHFEAILLVTSSMAGKNGMQTICFDLNNNTSLATNFYFDNIELCVNENYATEEEKAEAAEILVEEPFFDTEGKIPSLTNGGFTADFNDWRWTSDYSPALDWGAVEFYNTNYDFYRKFSKVKEGLYLLEAQAFYRTAEPTIAWNERETATVYAQLYANNNAVSVKNLMSESLPYSVVNQYIYDWNDWYDTNTQSDDSPQNENDSYVPNRMYSGNVAFEQGCYNNQVFTYVDDMSLQIGIRCKGATAEQRWTMFDNFKLTYVSEDMLRELVDNLVAAEGAMSATTQAALAELAAKKDTASYRTLATLYAALPIAFINEEVAAYQALQNAIAAVEVNIGLETALESFVTEVTPILADAKAGYEAGSFSAEEAKAQAAILNEYAARLARVYLTIDVAERGTLGDLILEKVENFSDVNYLILSGKLDEDDWLTISSLTSLVELDMENANTKAVPYSAFNSRESLERVVLPSMVTTIENYVFYGCTSLKSIVFPDGLETIGSYAFNDCRSLQSVEFPTTLQYIGYQAFYGTSSLRTLVLPEGLKDMDENVFSRSGITSVTFPSTLKELSGSCFYGCQSLTDIVFNGQTSIDSWSFEYCPALKVVKLPETLKKLGYGVFSSCYNLQKIELNEGLESIGNYAFESCDALTSIDIPSTVQSVGYYALNECRNLIKVTCRAFVPPYNEDAIIDRTGVTLYVPMLSESAYKQATGWAMFDVQGVSDMIPDDIFVMNDFRITWPEDLSTEYQPNVTIGVNYNSGTNKYGTLIVKGQSTMSMKQFKMTYDPNIARDRTRYYEDRQQYGFDRYAYNALISKINMRADNVAIDVWTRSNTWDFISFPFDVKVGDIRKEFDDTQYVIRKYDGEKRAEAQMNETWVDMTDDAILEAGQGYILRSSIGRYEDGGERWYNGFHVDAMQTVNKNNIFTNDDVEVSLAEYNSEFEQNRSWNLIGNPYPCFYDTRAMQTSAPIIVWDTYHLNYAAYSPTDDSYILVPGEAFFVQRPLDNGSILFKKEGRQINQDVRDDEDYIINNVRARRAAKADRFVFNLTLKGESQGDRTRFVINEMAALDYEAACDANKFMSLEKQTLQLYTLENDVRFAINERPLAGGIVNLGIQVVEKGLYTIALDTKAENEVYLIDHLLNTEVRLDGTEGYSFSSEAGTFDGRFSIRLGNGDVTGIKELVDTQRDNAVYYDLQGRRVYEPLKGIYLKDDKKVLVK